MLLLPCCSCGLASRGHPLRHAAARPRHAPHHASSAIEPAAKTRAIFFTESDYNSASRSWVGRVSVLRAAAPDAPQWVADCRNPTGLAVDSMRGRVYWTDPGADAIHVCDADGANRRAIGATAFGQRHNDGPYGLAVDQASGTLVWSAIGHGAFRCTDGGGAAVQNLEVGDAAAWGFSGGPWGIALNLRPGWDGGGVRRRTGGAGLGSSVYWTCLGRIRCCEIGSDTVRDLVGGLVDPRGLVLDLPKNRMFWTDPKAGKVQTSSLDGSRVCDVASGLPSPYGLALGPSHLYWTDRRGGSIHSCCLKSGRVSQVLGGLHLPEGVGLLNTAPRRHRSDPAGRTPPAAVPADAEPELHWRRGGGGGALGRSRQRRGSAFCGGLRGGAGAAPAERPTVQELMRRSAHALADTQRYDEWFVESGGPPPANGHDNGHEGE